MMKERSSWTKGWLIASGIHLCAVGVAFLLLLVAFMIGGTYLDGGDMRFAEGAGYVCTILTWPMFWLLFDSIFEDSNCLIIFFISLMLLSCHSQCRC